MKTIYLIYIVLPDYVYNTRIKYLIDSKSSTFRHKGNKVTGLYAWTTKKSILKEFLSNRPDIYIVKKKELSDKGYKKYKKDLSDLKLDKRRFYTDLSYREVAAQYIEDDAIKYESDEYVDVVTTKFEFVGSTVELIENMIEFGPASFIGYDYTLFNDKIKRALDILNYTSLYDTYLPTNPESDIMMERKDISDYQDGFNLTVYGNNRIHFDRNEYASLLYLFAYPILRIDNRP